MPNRVLKEVLLTSRKVDRLSCEEFEFYIRLMLLADDFGRFLADPVIVRSRAYPMKEGLKSSQIRKWLERLSEVGLIVLYRNDAEEFLLITKWDQRTRATASRYPEPDDCLTDDGHLSDKRPTSAHVDVDVDEDVDGTAKTSAGPAVRRRSQSVTEQAPRNEVFGAAFAAFREMRSASKRKLTARAEAMILRKLEELAPGDETMQARILDQSTMNGWLGVFPLKADTCRQEERTQMTFVNGGME